MWSKCPIMSRASYYCAVQRLKGKGNISHKRWLLDKTHGTWSSVADMFSGLYRYIYIYYQWQGLLFKTSLASFSALNICDEAAGMREKISLILLPSVKMETRQKEKRAVGHSSFHHLSNTHAWLKGLCKLGGLHHLYQTPSKMKRQAAATVNIDKALTKDKKKRKKKRN